MKKSKKVLALALALGMAMSTLTACGGTGISGIGNGGNSGGMGTGVNNIYNVEGKNKTTISVWTLDLGPGAEWLHQAAERFAEKNQDAHFADGKTGVYVEIDTVSNPTILNNLPSSGINMFFPQGSNIKTISQTGELLDITDIVTDPTREGGTLESKMFSDIREGMKGTDGKYYGLPGYEFYGLPTYNRKIFDREFAYFAADDATDKIEYTPENNKFGTAYLVEDLETKRSLGPDGKTGEIDGVDYSLDDGLPSTVTEFLILMDYLKEQCQVAPLIISGQYNYYVDYLLFSLQASLAGVEQMKNHYNGTGEIEIVTGYTNENLFAGIDYIKKPITEKVVLDGTDAYKSSYLSSKYYAIAVLEVLQREGYFSADSDTPTRNHLDAVRNLIMEGKTQHEESAILIEASYIYRLAKETNVFGEYEIITTKDAETLDIRPMPLPTKFTANDAQKEITLLGTVETAGFINANIKNNSELLKACKAFMAFLYSEEELTNFVLSTGSPRGITFDSKNEKYNSLPTYYKYLLEMRDNKNGSNVCYEVPTTAAGQKMLGSLQFKLKGAAFYYKENTLYLAFSGRQQHADKTYVDGTKDAFEALKLASN